MGQKKGRREYFVSKELRLSIAVMLLWALLITGFFTYIVGSLGDRIGSSTLLFAVIMTGYFVIVVVLSLFFSHRILGPFKRLKTELRLIRAGSYNRRLNVRKNDDLCMKAFIEEINLLVAEYEGMHMHRKDLISNIDSEIMSLLSAVKHGGGSPAELQDAILDCHMRLKKLSERE